MRRTENRLNSRLWVMGLLLGLCVAFCLQIAQAQEAGRSVKDKSVAKAEGTQEKPEAEEDKLSDRLTRKAIAQSDEDIMAEILRLMNEASYKLGVEFEAGDKTQALQQQILERVGDAIKAAAANRRKSKNSESQPAVSDRRKSNQGEDKKNEQKPAKQGEEKTGAASGETKRGGEGVEKGAISDGSSYDARRAWGHLPQRERDAVIQGRAEEYLERFRELIERYYRALQEAEEGNGIKR